MITNKNQIISYLNLTINDYFETCLKKQELIQKHKERCEVVAYNIEAF